MPLSVITYATSSRFLNISIFFFCSTCNGDNNQLTLHFNIKKKKTERQGKIMAFVKISHLDLLGPSSVVFDYVR